MITKPDMTTFGYVPKAARVPWRHRVVWPFTPAGRVRHALVRASRAPANHRLVDILVARLRRLQGKLDAATHDPLVTDSLSFLAWQALWQSKLDKASAWLSELQGAPLACRQRVSLRWRLMDALIAKGRLDAYVKQAAVFLGDPLLSWKEHAAPVLGIIRTVYEDVSSNVCASLLVRLNDDLARIGQLRTIKRVCDGNAGFESRDAADHWVAGLRSDLNAVVLSPRMHADALLGCSKVAEWNGDWTAMAFYANQARRVLPEHSGALYWIRRASLHAGDTFSEPLSDVPEGSAHWIRLRLMYRLTEHPTLDDAATLLHHCAGDSDLPDTPERLLIADVLGRALARVEIPDLAHQIWRADIAGLLQQRIGRFPWAEVYLAWKLIRVDRSYEDARMRLESKDVAELANASGLARVARIMLGIPTQPLRRSGDREALDVLEQSLCALVAADEGTNALQDSAVMAIDLRAARANAVFDEHPDLGPVADVLEWATASVSEDWRSVGSGFLEVDLLDPVPAWARWMLARTVLILCDPQNPEPFITKINWQDRACVWELERWMANSTRMTSISRDDILNQLLQRAAGETLGRTSSQPVPEYGQDATLVRELRSIRYRTSRFSAPSHRIASVFPELGELCDKVCAAELSLEVSFGGARALLAAGNPSGAIGLFEDSERMTQGAGKLTSAVWSPVLRYWMGVASARLGRAEAASIFDSILRGPKGLDARAQLAMLAIKENDLVSADRLLAGITMELPSSLYARALVAERRGEIERARQLAESFHVVFSNAPDPYAQAAHRLVAVLTERCGNSEGAMAAYRENLERDPADGISSARLRRLMLRNEYDRLHSREGQIAAAEPVPEVGGPIAWSESCALLRRGLLCPVAEIDDWVLDVGRDPAVNALFTVRPAWRQIVARRLLEGGRVADALATIRGCKSGTSPDWRQRAVLVLEAWDRVVDIGTAQEEADPAQLDRLRHHLQEMEIVPARERDEMVDRWAELVRQSIQLAEGGHAASLGCWPTLAPCPMAWVPALWSPSSEERSQAAAALAPVIAAQPGWNERQRNLLRALCAWTRGRSEDYLDAYASLEPDLDVLPVPGTSLWVAAATLWFRQDQWDKLIEGEMPDCVADLADPRVRLIVGLAYARSAIEDTKRNNARRALQRIQQARGTLKELRP